MKHQTAPQKTSMIRNSSDSYADGSSVAYCDFGKYPKPQNGYPGFWWFQYGIRDVGHALQSLEERGFIRWASKANCISRLKVDELKKILNSAGLSAAGKKAELLARVLAEIPEDSLEIPDYVLKYELTDLGKTELAMNGYVPYMHKHPYSKEMLNVWSVNKLFPNGDASNWREVVGAIEKP